MQIIALCTWAKDRFERPAILFGNTPITWGYPAKQAEVFKYWAEKAIALNRSEGVLRIETHAIFSLVGMQ